MQKRPKSFLITGRKLEISVGVECHVDSCVNERKTLSEQNLVILSERYCFFYEELKEKSKKYIQNTFMLNMKTKWFIIFLPVGV
jgi:hypothetical protein